jgi:hypothetical protein
MIRRVTVRLCIEVSMAAVTALLALATAVWPDWIEAVFGVDPDNHRGLIEWAVVAALVAVTATISAVVRAEWRRAASSDGQL